MLQDKNFEYAYHLNEKELVDYLEKKTKPLYLQLINDHLIQCNHCSTQLSLLILFAAENNLLDSQQDDVLDSMIFSNKLETFTRNVLKELLANK